MYFLGLQTQHDYRKENVTKEASKVSAFSHCRYYGCHIGMMATKHKLNDLRLDGNWKTYVKDEPFLHIVSQLTCLSRDVSPKIPSYISTPQAQKKKKKKKKKK